MILNDVIIEVRRLIQDNAAPQRYSDATLLGFANQTLKRMAVLRPDLFAYIGEIPCTAGQVLQSPPTESLRIIEIFQVKDGAGVTEVDRTTLDQTYPGWMNDPAGPTVNWMMRSFPSLLTALCSWLSLSIMSMSTLTVRSCSNSPLHRLWV